MMVETQTYIITISPKGLEVTSRGRPVKVPDTSTKTWEERFDVALYAIMAEGREAILPAINMSEAGVPKKILWVTTIPTPEVVPEP